MKEQTKEKSKPEAERNIYQRMHSVMQEVSYVKKEDKKVNNQYTFVSHDAVVAAVRGPLLNNGVVAITFVKGHQQDGNRTVAEVVVKFVNVDKPEEFIEVPAFGYGIDPQDKGPGKAISYAVKYAFLKALCLETGDDPERDNIEHKPSETPSKAVKKDSNDADESQITPQQYSSILSLVKDLDKAPLAAHITSDGAYKFAKSSEKISSLSFNDANRLILKLVGFLNEQKATSAAHTKEHAA